eukprot:442024-Hanusia_phi.AAC.1
MFVQRAVLMIAAMSRTWHNVEDFITRFEVTKPHTQREYAMNNAVGTRTTFGLMLKDGVVDNILVGTPAQRVLRAGDR